MAKHLVNFSYEPQNNKFYRNENKQHKHKDSVPILFEVEFLKWKFQDKVLKQNDLCKKITF